MKRKDSPKIKTDFSGSEAKERGLQVYVHNCDGNREKGNYFPRPKTDDPGWREEEGGGSPGSRKTL